MLDENINYTIGYIIPSYNHEKYIIQLLDSISDDAKTSDLSYEIIIINDGSTDNSELVIRNWIKKNNANKNITFTQQENKGITATLNKLISLSRSTYLRLCGSDDLIISGSTKIMYNHLQKDSNLIAVSGDGIIMDENGNKLYDSNVAYYGADINKLTNRATIAKELILHWCLTGPSTLIKKSHYDTVTYDENELIDDFFLFLSVIRLHGLKIIKDKVYYYRIHSSNISRPKNKTQRLRNQKSFLNGILAYRDMEKDYPALSATRSKSEAKIAYLESNYGKLFFKLLAYAYWRVKV